MTGVKTEQARNMTMGSGRLAVCDEGIRKQPVATASTRLGAIHRRIGMQQQFIHCTRIAGIKADANARGNNELPPIQ